MAEALSLSPAGFPFSWPITISRRIERHEKQNPPFKGPVSAFLMSPNSPDSPDPFSSLLSKTDIDCLQEWGHWGGDHSACFLLRGDSVLACWLERRVLREGSLGQIQKAAVELS